MSNRSKKLTPEGRKQLQQVIQEASKPIVPILSMKTMGFQGPIDGQVYFPFDQAVCKGKHLLEEHGYGVIEEYQQRYRDGRITAESLARAFQRLGPLQDRKDDIQLESRKISSADVWWLHLLGGFEPLEASRLESELSDHGSTKQFHWDLSEESRKRIIDRTIQDCELCREYPEKAYLANLWKSILGVLQLRQSQTRTLPVDGLRSSATVTVTLPAEQTMSDWVNGLAGVDLVGQINERVIKWGTVFLDQEFSGGKMPQRWDGFYHAWRQLAQEEHACSIFRIKDFSQKVYDLPPDPEDTIASTLEHLGIPQEQWTEYLARQLLLSSGWVRYFRWLGEQSDYHALSKPHIDTTQYLAVRLFYEVELTHSICQEEWGIEGTVTALTAYWNDRRKEYDALIGEGSNSADKNNQHICRDAWRLFHLAQFLELSPIDVLDLSFDDAQTLLQWLNHFPLDQRRLVWLEADEEH